MTTNDKANDKDGDIEAQLRIANDKFYSALARCSILGMEGVWLQDDQVVCIHPGWLPLFGWQRVRESWVGIFRGTQMHRVSVEILAIGTSEDISWVSCLEEIGVLRGSEIEASYAISTNIFRLVDERLLMVVHHASSVSR